MSTDIITNEYVFFYGGIYSQWFPCEFTIFNVKYNCAEQFMMAQKAIMFNDLDSFNKIMIATNPYDQKAIGRNVKNFNKVQWEERAKDIVIAGNLGKFGQNKELREQMLLTADKKFVEASPTDKIWGIGMGLSEIESLNPEKITPDMWRGTNWLGECLDYVKMKLTLE